MAARKRKLPEKKPARKEPGILAQAFAALSNTVATYPVITAGTVAFCVVFSFISANALWYQHGGHPSPFLRTRDAANPTALIGFANNPARLPPEDVTTFRIEREVAPPAVESNDHALALPEVKAPPAATGAQSVLVQDIQKELARRGLYDGKADGVIGPRTSAAILFFEESVGMEQTGEPSTRILAALRIDAATVAAIPAAIPAERPSGVQSAKPAASVHPTATAAAPPRTPPVQQTAATQQKPSPDPVAALIRGPDNARSAIPVPPAPVPSVGASANNLAISESSVSGAVVMQIQRGLINIAYTDVTADGVAGARTRAAIRQFEKHYRLPETGEPSEAVLKKLKSIGAL